MIGLRVNEQWIDLYPNTRIQIKRNTDLYVTGDPEFASNSYTLPFQIPATPKNRIALNFPEEIEMTNYSSTIPQAVIYAGEGSSLGLPLFSGNLYIKKGMKRQTSGSSFEVFVIVNGLNDFKSVKMSDMPWDLYELDTPEDMADHAKDTVENPNDHDYIFAQIFNQSFYNGEVESFSNASRYTNWYNPATAQFEHTFDQYTGAVMTPFYKTHVVFKKIVEYMGYNIVDNFHTIDMEFQRLVFYNNQNMYRVIDGHQVLDTVLDGAKHMVDKMPITEFVKRICRYFCLGIFVNNEQKKIEITPFKNILNQPDASNWTNKVDPDYDTDKKDTELPSYIGVKTDSADEISQLAENKDISEYGPATDYFYGPLVAPSFLYLVKTNQFWLIRSGGNHTMVSNAFQRLNLGGQGPPIELSCVPLYMNPEARATPTMTILERINYPEIGTPGKGELLEANEDGEFTIVKSQAFNHEEVRIFFYRYHFPFAEPGAILQSGITAADEIFNNYGFQHSLLFNGPNSVYDQFWKEWIYFMQHKKIVNRTLHLKLSDILSFREYHKIRIGGLSYFVKSMDITLTMQGIEPVQAELVSIPMS